MEKRSLKRIGEEQARDLSNFDGQGGNLEIADFGGRASGFHNEANAIKDRAITLTLKNLGKGETFDGDGAPLTFTPSACTLTIFDGINIEDGALKAVNSDGDDVYIKVTASPVDVAQAVPLLVHNPTNVVMMKMRVSDALQLENSFFVTHKSPFQKTASRQIRIQDHVDEYSLKDKLANINDGFTIDAATKVELDLIEAADFSLTLYCGAQANLGKAITKASNQAKRAVQFRKGLAGRGMRS